MKRTTLYLRLASLIGIAAVAGCGGGSSNAGDPDPGPVQGLLRAAADADELERSLKAGFTTVASTTTSDALASDASATGGAAPGNFSGTYTQEVNVDEFDAVRYDGNHLYIAPRRFANCCFFAAGDGAVSTGDPAEADSIRILSTDPSSATAETVGSIELDADLSVQGMYVEGDRLFALTAQSVYGTYGPFWADFAIWAPEVVGYRIYDMSDRSAPTLETDVTLDGIFVDSRRIGNTVYILTRYAPEIAGVVYGPQTQQDAANNESILAGVSLDDMLPSITIDGVEQALVDPRACYIPNDGTDLAYPVITNLTAVPLDNPSAFRNTCYNTDAYGSYVSETAIYFSEFLEQQLPDATRTRIHKFALSGTDIEYRGSGEVRGQVWRGGQADFRMSEHDGDLRVFSSEFDWSSPDFADHYLFVLRESGEGPRLEVIGELPNSTNPAPIGKPNEQLYGVRFLPDRAYAVTFEQIDPLYVFDLSDPADPVIAGELEVEGFSDFLHPVTNELLLGLGTDAAGAIKLELFDVTDLASPLSRGAVTIGEPGGYTEARMDRHAFTWQPDAGGVDRLAIPATVDDGIGQPELRTSLYLFEIRDKATPNLATLQSVGSLSPPSDGMSPWADRNRAFIHDDAVYYVRDELVWSADWNAPSMINGPF